MLEPRTLRQLPEAAAPRDDDLFPVSQYDPETNSTTTAGMRRDMFIADVIEAVAEARQELVDDFAAQNAQLGAAITALQTHDGMLDDALTQLNALDATMQTTIETLDSKVSHPVQWSEIEDKPASFPAAPTAWADVTSKPTMFPPAAHQHPQSDIANLVTDLGNKAPIAHVSAMNNPHGVTKAQVGLGNVSNLAPADLPVSTATQAALDAKASFNPAPATAITPVYGTAYQATKPSFISAMIDAAYQITVAGVLADTVELRVGANQAQVAAGTGGVVAASFRSSLTGIALTIGLGLGQRNQLSAVVPAGHWWSLRRTQGTTATIQSATSQELT